MIVVLLLLPSSQHLAREGRKSHLESYLHANRLGLRYKENSGKSLPPHAIGRCLAHFKKPIISFPLKKGGGRKKIKPFFPSQRPIVLLTNKKPRFRPNPKEWGRRRKKVGKNGAAHGEKKGGGGRGERKPFFTGSAFFVAPFTAFLFFPPASALFFQSFFFLPDFPEQSRKNYSKKVGRKKKKSFLFVILLSVIGHCCCCTIEGPAHAIQIVPSIKMENNRPGFPHYFDGEILPSGLSPQCRHA